MAPLHDMIGVHVISSGTDFMLLIIDSLFAISVDEDRCHIVFEELFLN